MGYTKIIQYGDITEIIEYEKNIDHTRKSVISALSKKRTKKILQDRKAKGVYERSTRSIRRSQNNFFRLCHHNNTYADTIHFVTITFSYDVTLKKATRHVARAMERIKKNIAQVPFSYISVPELTKEGRFHFHLLVYNLPPETSSLERKTRNFQRQFDGGYVDICSADYNSEGIAGYMAKYMAKAFDDFKNEAKRYYNCSRNIKRYTSAGSNQITSYLDLLIHGRAVQEKEYKVPWLGRCNYKKYKHFNYEK